MIICSKCGAENPLGSVFCRGCGSKLDLRNMSSGSVAGSRRKPWLIRHWIVLPIALGVLLVLLAILAVWPATRPVGMSGTRAGAARVKSQLAALAMVKPGQMLAPIFTEKDVNAYLEHFKAPAMQVESVSTDFGEGFLLVRVVRSLGGVTLFRWRIEPKWSQDVVCVPVGGKLAVRKVRMGHLGLSGPARHAVARSVHRLFAAQPEWNRLTRLDKIEISDLRLTVTVRK